MKVAIVQAPFRDASFPPYEAAQLAGCARQYGHAPFVLDLNARLRNAAGPAEIFANGGLRLNEAAVRDFFRERDGAIEAALDAVRREGPALAAFPVLPGTELASAFLAERLKRRDPRLTVVFVGAMFAHSDRALCTVFGRKVDALVQGLGDHAWTRLLRDLAVAGRLNHQPNIYFRSESGCVELPTGDEAALPDADDLPFADFTGFPPEDYAERGTLKISTHRGCRCRGWTTMNGERIFQELCYQRRVHPGRAHFVVDDFFGLLSARELGRFAGLAKDAFEPAGAPFFTWDLQTVVSDRFTPELLARLAEAGCRRLSLVCFDETEAVRRLAGELRTGAGKAGLEVALNGAAQGATAGGRVDRVFAASLDELLPQFVCWAGGQRETAGGADFWTAAGKSQGGYGFQAAEALVALPEGADARAASFLGLYERDLSKILSAIFFLERAHDLLDQLPDGGTGERIFNNVRSWMSDAGRAACLAHRRSTRVMRGGRTREELEVESRQSVERYLVCARWRLSQTTMHPARAEWDAAERRYRIWWGKEPVAPARAAELYALQRERRGNSAAPKSFMFWEVSARFGAGHFLSLKRCREERRNGNILEAWRHLDAFLRVEPGAPLAFRETRGWREDMDRLRGALNFLRAANGILERFQEPVGEKIWEKVGVLFRDADRGTCRRHRLATRLLPRGTDSYEQQRAERFLTCARWKVTLLRSAQAKIAFHRGNGRFAVVVGGKIFGEDEWGGIDRFLRDHAAAAAPEQERRAALAGA